MSNCQDLKSGDTCLVTADSQEGGDLVLKGELVILRSKCLGHETNGLWLCRYATPGLEKENFCVSGKNLSSRKDDVHKA